jgi:hypothetical protein
VVALQSRYTRCTSMILRPLRYNPPAQ